MIVVDSSVWIASLRNRHSRETILLKHFMVTDAVIVGDLVMAELLQGAKSDKEADGILQALARFPHSAMCSAGLAIQSAKNYRLLRARGITIRKTIDLIIGTFCIENGHALLHADRDFVPMAEHLGLVLA